MAGRGSISDTPDRSLCRRAPVSSPSPCSRRSRPEIISTSLLPPPAPRPTFETRSSTEIYNGNVGDEEETDDELAE